MYDTTRLMKDAWGSHGFWDWDAQVAWCICCWTWGKRRGWRKLNNKSLSLVHWSVFLVAPPFAAIHSHQRDFFWYPEKCIHPYRIHFTSLGQLSFFVVYIAPSLGPIHICLNFSSVHNSLFISPRFLMQQQGVCLKGEGYRSSLKILILMGL